jgi:hypothetical protein
MICIEVILTGAFDSEHTSYDAYLLAMMLLLTGSKFLKYMSSIRIMHNDCNDRT